MWNPTAANASIRPTDLAGYRVVWFDIVGQTQNAAVQLWVGRPGSAVTSVDFITHNGSSHTGYFVVERYGTSAARWWWPVAGQVGGTDPPSLTVPTLWGDDDFLWRTQACGTSAVGAGPPTGFTNIFQPVGTVRFAEKQSVTATEDPSDWTSPGGDSVASTIVIRPRTELLDFYSNLVLGDGAIGFWPLQEHHTSELPKDYSGNGNHITTAGGTRKAKEGPMVVPDESWHLGGATALTRAGIMSTTGDLTMELWIWLTAITQDGQLMMGDWTAFTGYSFQMNANRTIRGVAHNVAILNASAGTVSASAWHHLVMTRTSGTWRYYIDGVVDANTDNDTPVAPSGTTFYIGGGSSIDAYYAYAAIYNRGLTAPEVEEHFGAEPSLAFLPQVIML